jgi:RimJ/RimL family protein N-acetyltransferase
VLTDGAIRLVPSARITSPDRPCSSGTRRWCGTRASPEPGQEGFAHRRLAAHRSGAEAGTREGFAVEDAVTGAFLGIAGLVAIEHEANQAEIGYVVEREARGRGMATAARGSRGPCS